MRLNRLFVNTVCLLLAVFCAPFSAKAQDEIEDGTYDARVVTDSGVYTVPVEVDGGEVTTVFWPNGGAMHIHGADLDTYSDEASGFNYDGDYIRIEIDR